MSAEHVIRVGATGHRTYADADGVAARVRTALDRLVNLADGAASDDGDRARLVVVSPLAEGADRLVAGEVLRRPGSALTAALPFARGDYAEDFATPASRSEFDSLLAAAQTVVVMPPSATREAGYERVGRWVVDHCDALVALWDGEPSRGQGGTAEIVAYAADRGVPLLWVRVTRPPA